jgi:hypothetical protein
MKRIRILGVALLALVALSAVMAVAASAEEGFLPFPKKTGFTVEGGTSTLNTPANLPIVCGKLDASKGTLEKDKHGTVTLQWLECSVAGVAANSAGDAAKTILAKVLFLVCLINPTSLEFGIAAETDETVNLEVPALGVKITVKGRVIGTVLAKANTLATLFKVDFAGSKGVPTVKKCTDSEGTKEHTLTAESSLTKKAETASQEVVGGTVTFEEKVELMDT